MSDDGEDGKRDGMDRAERHANPHWVQCMLEAGKKAAGVKPYIFSDDLVLICRKDHPNASTHENRAMGPIMRECARLGYCEPTQDWVESTQKQNHRRPMRVWHSLLYKGPHRKLRRHKPYDPRQYKLDFDDED